MVGTPAQWIDVFVSTASQETWVVGSGGCDGSELFFTALISEEAFFCTISQGSTMTEKKRRKLD